MDVVAVIPAGGGSTGVPRTQLRPVGGMPLVARAILAARAVPSIDRVIVCTADPAIARVAAAVDAEVIEGPGELADESGSESALLHALDVLEERGERAEVLVLLHAASPFLDGRALAGAIDRVRRHEEDCVFSAVESQILLWRQTAEGAVGVNHDATSGSRADRETHYAETAAFHVVDVDGFRRARRRFFGRIGFAAVERCTAIELDTLDRLEVAEAVALAPSNAAPIDADALVADFGGVHADDRVVLSDDGHHYVLGHRGDGDSLAALGGAGVPILLLSADVHRVASARARVVPIEIIHGSDDKLAALEYWATQHGVGLDRVAYLGTGVEDLDCLRVVGWPIGTGDAPAEVRALARVVLAAPAGHGAVRELTERILRARQDAEPRPAPGAARRIHEILRRDDGVRELVRALTAGSAARQARPQRIAPR